MQKNSSRLLIQTENIAEKEKAPFGAFLLWVFVREFCRLSVVILDPGGELFAHLRIAVLVIGNELAAVYQADMGIQCKLIRRYRT